MKYVVKATAHISAMGGTAVSSILSTKKFDTEEEAEEHAKFLKTQKCIPFLGNTFHYPSYTEIIEIERND